MLNAMRFKGTGVLVWIILGLLIFGLAGFGITDVVRGGLASSVASVGDTTVSVQDYSRAVSRELRNQSNQQGRLVTMAEARTNNTQWQVLSTLTRAAAVDAETSALGISVSDDAIAREIAQSESFRGPDGQFSRQQFDFVLSINQLTEAELVSDYRKSLARDTVGRLLSSGLSVPPVLSDTILGYSLERRSFSYVTLTPDTQGTVPAPSDAELEAFHTEQAATFTVPETRVIRYALLDPAVVAAGIEVDDAVLRQAYDSRIETFQTPERRIVDRLVFGSAEEAEAAKTRLAAGEVTFAAIATEKGLSPEDIALGEVIESALYGDVKKAVFGAAEPGLVGPVESALGPALFQVNAILAATQTSFDEARDTLKAEYAAAEAARVVAELGAEVDDLVAGGSKVEDIVRDTEFTAGSVELPVTGTATGLATDETFRSTALAAIPGEEADLARTADGTLFVLRVEEVRPATLPPLSDIRDSVATAWTESQKRARAAEAAETLAKAIRDGTPYSQAIATLGLTSSDAGPITRDAVPEGLSAALVEQVFTADPNGVAVAETDSGTTVALVLSITSFDASSPENQALATFNQSGLDRSFSADFRRYYSMALEARDGVTVNESVMEQILAQIP